MGYVPKFIHLDHFIDVEYPFGVHWKHSYIQQSAKAIFNTYKEDIEEGTSITFVARGTSGAMIAGAMLNELHNINPTTKTYILIVRKGEDTSAHCSSLRGIDEVGTTRFIVVDDFISSGETIRAIIQDLDRQPWGELSPSNKYDMLCVSNFIDAKALKKNSCDDYGKWKGICSRFKYVICCPKPE
nr:MAG TPA: Orotate phosphoribosyltransferase [Crassvirales sp.]